ncbi:MAG: hypothetical protein RL398_2046 [Planctomycetota bacterium]
MPSSSESTSWEIVHDAAVGRPAAQDAFVRRYEPLVRRYFAGRWRLDRDHERVANAAQDVLLRCLSPGGPLTRLDPTRPSGFRAFLYGIVLNAAREHERAERRHRGTPLDEERTAAEVPADGPTASVLFDRYWAEGLVRRAWELVADRLRSKRDGELRLAVLRLRYVEDLAPEVIRSQLSLPSVRDVHRLAATGRYQFRLALLGTVAAEYPELDPAQVEAKCLQLLDLL